MIVKTSKGYQVRSHDGKKALSADDLTKEQAAERLKKVETFKHIISKGGSKMEEEKTMVLKSVSELHAEMRTDIRKGGDDASPVFTTDEATELMKVMLEDQAIWRLARFYPEAAINEIAPPVMLSANGGDTEAVESEEGSVPSIGPDADQFDDIVEAIYRDTIKRWRFDPVTLQVCRKAKFSRQMVTEIVDGVNDDYQEKASSVGKSLAAALRKVSERIGKSWIDSSFDIVKASGAARPVRVWAFLKAYSSKRKEG